MKKRVSKEESEAIKELINRRKHFFRSSRQTIDSSFGEIPAGATLVTLVHTPFYIKAGIDDTAGVGRIPAGANRLILVTP